MAWSLSNRLPVARPRKGKRCIFHVNGFVATCHSGVCFSDACPGTAQEFGHPQARFLHEKRRHLPGGAQAALAPLLGAINRATFVAIDSAMFIGTVGCLVHTIICAVHGTLCCWSTLPCSSARWAAWSMLFAVLFTARFCSWFTLPRRVRQQLWSLLEMQIDFWARCSVMQHRCLAAAAAWVLATHSANVELLYSLLRCRFNMRFGRDKQLESGLP